MFNFSLFTELLRFLDEQLGTISQAHYALFLKLIPVLFLPMILHINGNVNRDFPPLPALKQSTIYMERSSLLEKQI